MSVGSRATPRILCLAAAIVVCSSPGWAAEKTAATPPQVNFNRQIRPILSAACFQCHGPAKANREADLRLDTKDGAFARHGDRLVIVPGKPAESELYRCITHSDPDERMPPADAERQLSATEIDTIRLWIEQGATWEEHWSLTPMGALELPQVKNTAWVRNAIDRFVLARLEAEGLEPAPEADGATLIRRLSLDLTGLPPKLSEIDAFLADKGPNAYEKLVDRLLASPHYGERMAQDWLDASRFADTHGYHVDSSRDMWRWRDWVIDALNRNVPFDQFATEQLAGDLVPEPTESSRIASGFNRNHGINFEGGAIPEELRVEYVADRVHTTATVFLGLTMKCARCHDHKFDPISQREYYRFFALFNAVPENGIDGAHGNATPLLEFPTPAEAAKTKVLTEQMAVFSDQLDKRNKESRADETAWVLARRTVLKSQSTNKSQNTNKSQTTNQEKTPVDDIVLIPHEQRTPAQVKTLRDYYLETHDAKYKSILAERTKVRRQRDGVIHGISSTMVMQDMAQPRPTYVLKRGQYDQHDVQVQPGVPSALPPLPERAPHNRLGLALWLASPDHPLTSRVTVNRYWQMYFGTGIVKTAENFGAGGELPSHPQLLDWLALRFVESNWNIKAFQKLIVTSATYRQSSRVTPGLLARDPENRLLARGPRFRLSAEFIRDNALVISGLLVRRVGGPSVRGYQPEGLWDEVAFGIKTYGAQVYVQDHGEKLYRRGMYSFWKRSCPPPSLATFDAPSREVCVMRRERANTPLQSLALLNDPAFVEAARAFAERIMKQGGDSDQQRVAYAFRLATGRHSTADEREVLLEEFHARLNTFNVDVQAAEKLLGIGELPCDESLDKSRLAAWTMVARIILNLDETISKN